MSRSACRIIRPSGSALVAARFPTTKTRTARDQAMGHPMDGGPPCLLCPLSLTALAEPTKIAVAVTPMLGPAILRRCGFNGS
jgi:hypothetical protein